MCVRLASWTLGTVQTRTVVQIGTAVDFAQRKRLADAERKLQTKPTKAASESRRIAGNKIEAAGPRRVHPFAAIFMIRCGVPTP
jgi:hypothetical protein